METLLVLLAALGVTCGQPHHELTGTPGVACYECHGPHHHYPSCMDTIKPCTAGQVCEVQLKEDHPETHCLTPSECTRSADSVLAECAKMPGAPCPQVTCCHEDACVTSTVNTIMHELTLVVTCPESCPAHVSDLSACSGQITCTADHFCQLSQNENSGSVTGKCEPRDTFTDCREQVTTRHCDRHHECRVGCCWDAACLAATLGVNTTPVVLTTVPTTASNTITTTTNNNNNPLGALSCTDLSHVDCSVLNSLCLKIDCPDVCASCVNTTPVVLTTVPTTASTTTTTTTTNNNNPLGALTCTDLSHMDCSVLDSLCLKIDCPDVCAACEARHVETTTPLPDTPTHTFAASASTTVQPVIHSTAAPPNASETSGQVFLHITDAPSGTTGQTFIFGSDAPPGTPDVSSQSPATSTGEPSRTSVGVTGGGNCVDTLLGVSCANIPDVCKNQLLLDYCAHFCGLCFL